MAAVKEVTWGFLGSRCATAHAARSDLGWQLRGTSGTPGDAKMSDSVYRCTLLAAPALPIKIVEIGFDERAR